MGVRSMGSAVRWSWLAVLGSALLFSPVPAASQGSPAPGANQAFLYELDEDAVLVNQPGNVLVPDPSGQSPTGLIDSVTGVPGMPFTRNATSQLQGVAAFGSVLCPVLQEITVGMDCTIIATGMDRVQLGVDPQSGQLVPTSGEVHGTYAVVVQLDNTTDSPELPVQTGIFKGTINFQAPLPLGFIRGGTLTVDSWPGVHWSFDAVFRQPFRQTEKPGVVTQRGRNVRSAKSESSARLDEAFYLLDNGQLQEVRPDERAVGWPTVRFEITITGGPFPD